MSLFSMSQVRRAMLATLALSTAALALPAQASVFVVGGGLATECSKATFKGLFDERAMGVCNQALESEAMDRASMAGTLVNRGVMYLRRMDLRNARQDFDRSVLVDPTLGEAFINRGAAMIAQRQYEPAIAEIDKGLQLGSEEPEKAYFNRALAYEGLGEMKRAYFDYQKAIELKPDWEAPKAQLLRFTVTRSSN